MFTRSARYYDAIYAAAGKDYKAEVALLQRLLDLHGLTDGNALLDVACGTGGHLAFLRDTYEVEGLDIDKAMLEIAQDKLPDIPLHQGDMVDFSLHRRFDFVINLFSSIGYVRTQDHLEKAIISMANHTHPGGLVIVEPWIYPEDFKPGKAHAVFVDQEDMKIARMDVSRVEGRLSILNFHYLVAGDGGVSHFEESHEITLFTHDEYISAIKAASLAVVHDAEGVDGRGLYIGIKPLEGGR